MWNTVGRGGGRGRYREREIWREGDTEGGNTERGGHRDKRHRERVGA